MTEYLYIAADSNCRKRTNAKQTQLEACEEFFTRNPTARKVRVSGNIQSNVDGMILFTASCPLWKDVPKKKALRASFWVSDEANTY